MKIRSKEGSEKVEGRKGEGEEKVEGRKGEGEETVEGKMILEGNFVQERYERE